MSRLRLLLWSLVLAAGLVGPLVGGANTADASNLVNTTSVTTGGLTFTFSACQMNLSGAGNVACTTGAANSIAVSAVNLRGQSPTGGRAVGFLLQDAGFLSNPAVVSSVTSGGATTDVTFTVTVSGTSAAIAAVNWAKVMETSLAGSTNNTGTSSVLVVSSGGGLTAGSRTLLNAADAVLTNTVGSTSNTASSLAMTSGATSFTVNLDLKVTSSNTGGLQMSTAQILFAAAPEPVSTSVFLVGLAGLGAVRRRRNQARAAG